MHQEEKAFNRQWRKLMKSYKRVTLITADFNRELFTRHGLHTNNQGKEMIAVLMYWKEDRDQTDSDGTYSNTRQYKKQCCNRSKK